MDVISQQAMCKKISTELFSPLINHEAQSETEQTSLF